MAVACLLGLIAETHVHVGVGQSVSALDLPVARERTTQYPFAPGSGVKGAFNVWARQRAGLGHALADWLFGKEGAAADGSDDGSDGVAGALLASDARLLLLPVRSLSSAYKWVTCRGILGRFARDAARADPPFLELSGEVDKKHFLGKGDVGDWLGLEEREFECAGEVDQAVRDAVGKAIPLAGERARLEERLVVLHDDDFAWFARWGLPVMSRNALDGNKIVKRGALWQEECLPPDTVLYLTLGERQEDAVDTLTKALAGEPYIQMGGNETIGQGWFCMAQLGCDAGNGGEE